jgi:hypothetical protein
MTACLTPRGQLSAAPPDDGQSGGMRGCTSAIAILLVITACNRGPSSCEQRATATASWNALHSTPVITVKPNSDASLIAPWVAAYEAFRTRVESMMEGAPEAVDDEVANTQTAINGMDALLASKDADSSENRPRLSSLIARLDDKVASLFRAMDAACA